MDEDESLNESITIQVIENKWDKESEDNSTDDENNIKDTDHEFVSDETNRNDKKEVIESNKTPSRPIKVVQDFAIVEKDNLKPNYLSSLDKPFVAPIIKSNYELKDAKLNKIQNNKNISNKAKEYLRSAIVNSNNSTVVNSNNSTIVNSNSSSITIPSDFANNTNNFENKTNLKSNTFDRSSAKINKSDKLTVKDKVKRQRLSGQSGIGEDFKVWKSEEEMRQRQQYD